MVLGAITTPTTIFYKHLTSKSEFTLILDIKNKIKQK